MDKGVQNRLGNSNILKNDLQLCRKQYKRKIRFQINRNQLNNKMNAQDPWTQVSNPPIVPFV